MASIHKDKRFFRLFLGLLLISACAPSCAPLSGWLQDPWAADYQTAERRARASQQTMFIVFRDGRDDHDRELLAALKDPSVASNLGSYVRCNLYASHEPDRRYADQFGVQRPPAIMLLHPDGTYHRFAGPLTPSAISSFFTAAQSPGAQLVRSPFIALDVHYRWFMTQDGAEAAAKTMDAPMLVAIHRVGTADWRKLSELLERPEVFRRFANMAHFQMTTLNPLAEEAATPWGDVGLPALVLVGRDGTIAVLEKPTTSEAIVHFATRAAPPVLPGMDTTPSPAAP